MTQAYDVIVVGGGAVGAACARELAEAGRKVLVLERGEAQGEAWRAAAGMLAAQMNGADDPLFALGLAGRERLAELAPALLETTGVDVRFWQEGIARIATDEAEATTLRSHVAWQRQQGHVADWFDAGEVKERWPTVGPNFGALWAPQDGALNPVALVEALLKDATRLGATVVQDQAFGLDRQGDRVSGVIGRERYSAPDVVIAAGAWSRLLTGLPRPIAVEPVRGQMAALSWPDGVPPAILMSQQCYLVAREGEAIVGSTMEHAGFSAEATAQGIAEIFTGIGALFPTLAGRRVLRTWAGLRPTTPDGLPIIGQEPKLAGLWYATGHGRNGVLLSAITGRLLARLLAGEQDPDQLNALRPERYWDW